MTSRQRERKREINNKSERERVDFQRNVKTGMPPPPSLLHPQQKKCPKPFIQCISALLNVPQLC